MAILLSIDPGTTKSGWCIYEGRKDRVLDTVVACGVDENEDLLRRITDFITVYPSNQKAPSGQVVIEWITSYGMKVGQEVFETCLFAGRCYERAMTLATTFGSPKPVLITRKEIKMALVGRMNSKDTHVRQALIEMFGPTKEQAIGKKASPGPLYGVTSHGWSALAVAVVYMEKLKKELGMYFDY